MYIIDIHIEEESKGYATGEPGEFPSVFRRDTKLAETQEHYPYKYLYFNTTGQYVKDCQDRVRQSTPCIQVKLLATEARGLGRLDKKKRRGTTPRRNSAAAHLELSWPPAVI